jgi:acyl-coenzyme A synthetase/AMP-(fatty) acid ligase
MFFDDFKTIDKLAVIDGDTTLTYGELDTEIRAIMPLFSHQTKALIALQIDNSLSGLVYYLAALRCGHCVMLLPPSLCESQWKDIQQTYSPMWRVTSNGANQISDSDARRYTIDPRVAVLLSTSGSTGNAKHVALSYANLQSNAESINAFLPIVHSDNTLCSLPLHYAYGLSIVNSHLYCGATLVFTRFTVVERAFFTLLTQTPITSIAGVPHTYEMLLRVGLTKHDFPALRYITQAGGKLSVKRIQALAEYTQRTQKQFYLMYGQTEATARIAWLPPEKVNIKPNSIGQAIPNGTLLLRDDTNIEILQPNVTGHLCYRGPNVMLGYVESAADLCQFHSPSELNTGDLAYRDDDGDYVITGRTKRMIKVHGQRISLDTVEQLLADINLDSMCIGEDNRLIIVTLLHHDDPLSPKYIAGKLNIHPSTVSVFRVEQFPMTVNGKADYVQLKAHINAL